MDGPFGGLGNRGDLRNGEAAEELHVDHFRQQRIDARELVECRAEIRQPLVIDDVRFDVDVGIERRQLELPAALERVPFARVVR
jgi:hypothetical protein